MKKRKFNLCLCLLLVLGLAFTQVMPAFAQESAEITEEIENPTQTTEVADETESDFSKDDLNTPEEDSESKSENKGSEISGSAEVDESKPEDSGNSNQENEEQVETSINDQEQIFNEPDPEKNITVKVTVPPHSFDREVELKVDKVASDKKEELKNLLNLNEEEETLAAYDVRFQDKETSEEVKPENPVSVDIEVDKAAFDEAIDNSIVIKQVDDYGNSTQIASTDDSTAKVQGEKISSSLNPGEFELGVLALTALMKTESEPSPLADGDASYNPFINIEKQFIGLSEDEIPSNFQVTLKNNSTNESKDYGLGQADKLVTDNSINYIWKIEVPSSETNTEMSFSVSEKNYTVNDYTLNASVTNAAGQTYPLNGDEAVKVSVVSGTVTLTNKTVITDDHRSFPDFTVDKILLVNLSSGGEMIITRRELSAPEQNAIRNVLKDLQGNWNKGAQFYVIRDEPTFVGGNTHFTWDKENETLGLDSKTNKYVFTDFSYSSATNEDLVVKNEYTPNTASLSISKTVSGNMAENEKQFDFELTLSQNSVSFTQTLKYIKTTVSDGEKIETPGTLNAIDGKYTFNLKDGESIRFEIKKGLMYTVTEVNNSDYQVYINGNLDSDSSTDGVINEDTNIQYRNDKDVPVPTGANDNNILVYLITMVVGLSFAILYVLQYRRKHVY